MNRDAWFGPVPVRAGVGLRGPHHGDWLDHRPACGWLELHAENYFADGGALPQLLETLRQDYPLSVHGVGLGLGSPDDLDQEHLRRLRRLVDRLEPAVVSEHLCWGALDGEHYNDLLPLPRTESALARMISRVGQLQETLGRTVLIEHLAAYVEFPESTLSEAEFLIRLARASGCGILLDLGNLVVNARNHGSDPHAFLNALPPELIGEIHLAGQTDIERDGRRWCIDDHGGAVDEAVWQLYRRTLERWGPVPTLIEWDNRLPPLEGLLAEARRADEWMASTGSRRATNR